MCFHNESIRSSQWIDMATIDILSSSLIQAFQLYRHKAQICRPHITLYAASITTCDDNLSSEERFPSPPPPLPSEHYTVNSHQYTIDTDYTTQIAIEDTMQVPDSVYSSASNWLLLPAHSHYRQQNQILSVPESLAISSFGSPKVICHDMSNYQRESTFSYHKQVTDETPLLFNTFHQAHGSSYFHYKDIDSLRTENCSPDSRRRQLQIPIPVYNTSNQLHSPTDSDTTEAPSILSLRKRSYSKLKEKLPKQVKFTRPPENIRLKTLKESEKENSLASSTQTGSYNKHGNSEVYRLISSKTYHPSHTCVKDIRWRRLRKTRLKKQATVLEYSIADTLHSVLDVGFAQAQQPLNCLNFYFDVEILDGGDDNCIAVGLTNKEYPSFMMPGWQDNSVAFHADDGKIYFGAEEGTQMTNQRVNNGDIITCGVLFDQEWKPYIPQYNIYSFYSEHYSHGSNNADLMNLNPKKQTLKVFFMLNKRMIAVKYVDLLVNQYYPTIGMLSDKAKVKVTLMPNIQPSSIATIFNALEIS